MNLDFEDQLRADLAAVEATPRPSLAQHAFQSHRTHQKARRRITLMATGCAAAVVGVTTGLALNPAPTPQTTASLVDHVTSALNSTTAISYATTTGVETTRLVETWAYGNQVRGRDFAASTGEPVVDFSSTVTGTKQTNLWVNYPQRTWSTFSNAVAQSFPPPKCGSFALAEALAGTQAQNWKTVIAAALKCSTVTVIDHQQIDGIPAIELRTHSEASPLSVEVILWIDPTTYLPVRSVIYETDKTVSATTHKIITTHVPAITTTYDWLPPTKSNLADLSVPIPPGFKEASMPRVVPR
jgi:hypothetical protein